MDSMKSPFVPLQRHVQCNNFPATEFIVVCTVGALDMPMHCATKHDSGI